MKFRYLNSLLIFGFLIIAIQLKAQFPYIQSFQDNQAPNMVFGGNPNSSYLTSNSSDPLNGGYLRLTNADGSQTGFVYNNSILPTTFGMDVEFEYFMYGGSGADGLAFFLFDAATTNFSVGRFGGALGYAHSCEGPGISNGYLGIGFDAFGNFSSMNECRSGTSTGAGSIIVRGAGNGSSIFDYPYITGINTNSIAVDPFPLTEGSTRSPLSTMPGYRKAIITIRPLAVGFSIAIKVQHGITITEVLTTSIITLPPANFKFGFSASTGGSTNFHEIRNLKISIPTNIALVAPIAVNDILPQICNNATINYNIIANDTTKNLGGTLLASTIDLDTIGSGTQDSLTVPLVGKFKIIKPLGEIRFTPLSTFVGTYSVSYKISDSYGKLSNGASLTVSTREAPVLTSSLTKSIKSGESVNLDLSTTPVLLQAIFSYPTPIATGGVTGGTPQIISNSSKILDVLKSPSRLPQTVTYLVSPFANNCNGNSKPVVITVTNGNTAPIANADKLVIKENNTGTINILLNDRDANTDALQVTENKPPKNGTYILLPNGNVTYTPNKDFIGNDTLFYNLCDAPLPSLCTIGQLVISVIRNNPPIALPDSVNTFKNVKVSVNVITNDSDPEGTILKTTVVTDAATVNRGVISGDNLGNFTYTPKLDFVGRDNYTYTVCDADQKCSTGLITFIINPTPNKRPLAINDTVSTEENLSVNIFPLKNDSDPDGLLVTNTLVTTSPNHGILTIGKSDGSLKYEPNFNYTGKDSLLYTICDNGSPSLCSNAWIILTILPKPDLPLFIPEGFSPNGDIINQQFKIEGAKKFKVNLQIFNRWGDKVYESLEYKNDWEGTSNQGVKVGQTLPDGTYFYIVDLNNGQDPISKFITISR